MHKNLLYICEKLLILHMRFDTIIASFDPTSYYERKEKL